MRIRVSAPATTANIGPGFDCLGAALALRLEVTATPGPPAAEPDLVARAAASITGRNPEVRIEQDARFPVGRGLGSSAAAIAAGLLIGCALAGREPDPESLLDAGLALEGHPDNLAPCLLGGIVLAARSAAGLQVMRFEPPETVRPVVLVPDAEMSTQAARGVLPAQVPMADAVASAARTAGLLAVLTGAAEATPGRLLALTEDVLHQPHRAPLMPATAEALGELRARGVAAAVSGAGPSLVCLVPAGEPAPAVGGWDAIDVGWDDQGARMTVADEGEDVRG